MTEPRTPTLDQVITRALQAWAGERSQVFIAQVTAYDHTIQRVEVQPVNRAYYGSEEAGEYRPWSGVLADVPVVFPSFGEWVIVAPLEVGDYVLCIVSTRSIDEWKVNGGTGIEAQDVRLCMSNDAIAIPGLWPDDEALGSSTARAGELVLSKRDGSTQLRIKDGEVIITAGSVRLGSPAASDFVALSSLVSAELAKISTVIAAHSAQLIALAQPGGVYTQGGVAASKTRAE